MTWGGGPDVLHGFEYLGNAAHGPIVQNHYTYWLDEHHREAVTGFAPVLTAAGGGDTDASEVAHMPFHREEYHTERVAERTIRWLGEHRNET